MIQLYLECTNGCRADLLAGALYQIDPSWFDSFQQLADDLSIEMASHDNGYVLRIDHDSSLSLDDFLQTLTIDDIYQNDVDAILASLQEVGYTLPYRHSVEILLQIIAVSYGIHAIKPTTITVGSIATGSGYDHDHLIPRNETLALLEDYSLLDGTSSSELCDPVAAAIIAYYAKPQAPNTPMRTTTIGLGADEHHSMRVRLVELSHTPAIVELVTNVDDQSPEEIGYTIDVLYEHGALDVYTTSVHAKKNRPGILLTCMCKKDDKEEMMQIMFQHLSTLGIREYTCQRYALKPHTEVVETEFGPVRLKISEGYGATRYKYEYEDLSRIAKETGLSIQQIKHRLPNP